MNEPLAHDVCTRRSPSGTWVCAYLPEAQCANITSFALLRLVHAVSCNFYCRNASLTR